jgi:hypothetical protein
MLVDFLRSFYRRAYGMESEAAVKLMRALVDAGYIADDQRADAAIAKVAISVLSRNREGDRRPRLHVERN